VRADVGDHVESQESEPQSFVRVRQRLAEAAAGNHGLSRDFGSCSIFDFFDSIAE
jgi:hypothetical protein